MQAALGRRLAAWAVLTALLIAGLLAFLAKGTSELPVYTRAAERMAARQEIYRPGEAKPFTYPPAFALPFLAFLPIPERLHRAAWYLVNVALLARLVLLVRAVAVAPFDRVRAHQVLFWATVAALAARHLLENLANQSHDLLVALCVAQCARDWGREREWRAGIYAGLGAALKATPLLLLLPFALQRRPKPLVAAVLALAVASLLPDLLYPRGDGVLWMTAWRRTALEGVSVGAPASLAGQWSARTRLNQSLAGTLHRLAGPPSPPRSISPRILAAQLAVLLFVLAHIGMRRRSLPPDEQALLRLGQVGLVACAMVLLSPMSSKSHFCVLLLPAAYCATRLVRGPRDRLLRLLLVCSFLAASVSAQGLVGRALASRMLDAGAVTWSAVLLLLATGRALTAPGPPSVSLPR